MTETYQCGDHAALVGYLYDDCEPGEREAIAAHITKCAACAGELETLGGVRRQLASWVPPETRLGFRIAPASDEPSGVLSFEARERARGATLPWWQQGLPAWAQLAAAALIFVSGIAIGASRAGAPVPSEASPALKASLAALDQRLTTVEALPRPTAVSLQGGFDAQALLLEVRREIRASEERSRLERVGELSARMFEIVDTNQQKFERIDDTVAKVRNEFGSALYQLAFQR
jgi:hypothetical protein